MSGDNTSASPIEAIETALPASPEPDNAVAGDPKPHVEESSESKPPQSALTAKFTEAEWDVLKEFREKLPDVFQKAYVEKPEAERLNPINLWGVTIDPHNFSDAKTSVILMKFLRAKELNVQDAQTMMVATLRWRDEFDVEAAMKEEFPEDVFGKLGRNFGHDKEGRPVSYNLYGTITDMKAVFGDVPRFLRWRVKFMEESIQLLDFENVDQMVQVHDYEGVSLFGRDQSQKNAAAEASSIFGNHYPEFLSRKFFVNIPSILTWVFWLFKPLISAKTFAKMSIVGAGKSTLQAALSPVIDIKELPIRYGGEAEGFD